MEKKLETREDGKTRIVCGQMVTRWFKDQDSALRFIGRHVLKCGGGWVAHIQWKILK